MNRTTAIVLFCLASLIGNAAAQGADANPATAPQNAAVKKVVEGMVKAEAALTGLRMTMATTSKMPGGLEVTTRGELRVLPARQPGAKGRLFTRLEYAFGDGMKGRMETAHTSDGIVLFEDNPAFGAVFLRMPAEVVADLEWASEVLKRSDLPGMVDGRAQSPLGSGMVMDLMRTFDLAAEDPGEHAGEKGVWLRGARKGGMDDQDPDLPLSDRVEVFVRERDHALMLSRFFVGSDVFQEILVEKLEVGAKLTPEDFRVDGHSERIRNVQDYAPMWEQVKEAIAEAEAKAPEGVVRPSKRAAKSKKQEPSKDGK